MSTTSLSSVGESLSEWEASSEDDANSSDLEDLMFGLTPTNKLKSRKRKRHQRTPRNSTHSHNFRFLNTSLCPRTYVCVCTVWVYCGCVLCVHVFCMHVFCMRIRSTPCMTYVCERVCVYVSVCMQCLHVSAVCVLCVCCLYCAYTVCILCVYCVYDV